MGSLGAMILLLGIVVVSLVWQLTGRLLRNRLDQEAVTIAANLSDAASAPLMGKNALELFALATKYARLDRVAYVFIEDAKGNVVSHSFARFPEEIRPSQTPRDRRQAEQRTITLTGRLIYETTVPILEGQIGSAHVGMESDAIREEIASTLVPLVATVAILLIAGLTASAFIAQCFFRPIVRLMYTADNMTKGDLDTPIGITSGDELGELACSLERMRASLREAMLRLSRA